MISRKTKHFAVLILNAWFPINVMSACPYMASEHKSEANETPPKLRQLQQFHGVKRLYKELTNGDFAEGTYRITQPGTYVLAEDIVFAPNSANFADTSSKDVLNCCKPRNDQLTSNGGIYPDNAYALGFFAAITVESDDVEIDLNSFTISQSKEHALMQPFFAVIELSSTPFIPGQGPADFGSIVSARDVVVRNGRIGRSSHHGIHGNGNVNVKVTNVDFVDFSVAAIALNGVEGLEVEHCHARSREDVPVLGIFSSALFIHQYLRDLHDAGVNTKLKVGGEEKSVMEIRYELERSIFRVYKDVILHDRGYISKEDNPEEYALFHNKFGVIEGNAYGFVTNHLGHATGGFPFVKEEGGLKHSQNVHFEHVTVVKLEAAILDTVALIAERNIEDDIFKPPKPIPAVDISGSLFQVRNAHPDDPTQPLTISTLTNDAIAEYTGNVVSNAQLIVAKCILNDQIPPHLPTKTNTINAAIIAWAESSSTTKNHRLLTHLLHHSSGYICNTDIMFHVNKGVVAFKIDNTDHVTMDYCHANNILNRGPAGSTKCGHYVTSHPQATSEGYGGAHARGWSLAGSRGVSLYKCEIDGVVSRAGSVFGYDVHTDSEGVELDECTEGGLKAEGEGPRNGITKVEACGLMFRQLTRNNRLKNYCFKEPIANGGPAETVLNTGTNNRVTNDMCL